jgi:hypothetical protein
MSDGVRGKRKLPTGRRGGKKRENGGMWQAAPTGKKVGKGESVREREGREWLAV